MSSTKDEKKKTVAAETERVRPVTAWVVSIILIIQALALAGTVIGLIIGINDGALTLIAQLFLIFLMLLATVWVGAAGISVLSGRAWTRAAILLIQVFAIALAINYFTTGDVWVGVVILIPALVVLVLMMTPGLNDFIKKRGESLK